MLELILDTEEEEEEVFRLRFTILLLGSIGTLQRGTPLRNSA